MNKNVKTIHGEDYVRVEVLEDTILHYKNVLEDVLTMMNRLEHVSIEGPAICPVCDCPAEEGHEADCALDALILRIENAAAQP